MAKIEPQTYNPLMPRLHLILLLSFLTLMFPGWAEAGQEKAPVAQARPLNLSLPRDVLLHTPANGQTEETLLRNLHAPAQTRDGSNASTRPTNLPYGAGYEHRHQEMGGTGSAAGSGGATGSGAGAGNGAGRRGR
jgi:hypothetical protein